MSTREPLAAAWSRAVKEQRKALGLTQTELADAVGTTQVTISRIEHGLTTPSAQLQARLVVALGIPQDRWYQIQREGGVLPPAEPTAAAS